VFVPPLLVSILLYALTNLNLTRDWQQNYHSLFLPIRTSSTSLRQTLSSALPTYSTAKNDQLNQLLLENQTLKSQLADLKSQSEYQKTASQYQSSPWTTVPAKFVSQKDFLYLTVANLDKIAPGQPVVADHQFIGTVISITAPTIKVLPLQHPDTNLDVQLSSGQQAKLNYENQRLQLGHFPTGQTLNPGDDIFTSASPLIPENLYIGRVDQIISSPSDTLSAASIIIDYKLTPNSPLAIITLDSNH
jgi:cell shape-determining protein MreC